MANHVAGVASDFAHSAFEPLDFVNRFADAQAHVDRHHCHVSNQTDHAKHFGAIWPDIRAAVFHETIEATAFPVSVNLAEDAWQKPIQRGERFDEFLEAI